MGCGGSKTEGDLQNEEIEKQLRAERDKITREIKLLLLGTGESGKSTIAKQMKIMHLDGFTKEERDTYRSILHSNIVDSMGTLLRQANVFNLEVRDDLRPIAARFTDTMELSSFINAETARGIAELWREPAIQQTYERRAEYQLPGSVDYAMQHCERLLLPNSAISDDDILRCRMRTTGIVEIDFEVEKTSFKMVDVGGQRSERKKWFHCFAEVTAVLFCVALNEYDEKLFEDERVNRMVESLNLFKEVCNNKFFNNATNPTSMILFLNKSDLFRDKIKKTPITNLFPDYKGPPADFDAATAFIKEQFMAKSADPAKLIFTHVTCATDTENVRIVFNAVRTSILHKNLTDANIM